MESSTTLPNSNGSSYPKIPIIKLVSSIGIGTFMSTLDALIIFIITNRVKDFYGVTPNIVQWIVLAYLLVMMAFTVIAGDLGDKYGNKLIFQIGMVIFAIGSLFCYLSIKFLVNSIMSATPKEKLGVASGLIGLTASIAINLGIALSTAILTLATSILSNNNGLDPFSSGNYGVGLQWVFGIFAVITGIGAILSYFRGPETRKEIAEVTFQEH